MSAAGPEEPEFDPEIDQEFEDACLALATTELPGRDRRAPAPSSVTEVRPPEADADVPVRRPTRSFGAATAGDLAELDPESEAEITAKDLPPVPPAPPIVPVQSRPEPTFEPPKPPAWGQPVAPDRTPGSDGAIGDRASSDGNRDLSAAKAELAATKTELESLRADFQAERFRSRNERLRLEDELAAARQAPTRPEGDELGSDETGPLRREIEVLRGELAALRSRQAEEVDRLEADVKAAQAREAQTVIAAQLAEDELKAVRAEAAAARATASDVIAVRSDAETMRQRVEELQQHVRALEAQLTDTEKDLRISRETSGERLRQMEVQLATREAELVTTQQELLESEGRRADEAASFLAALQKQV